VPRGLFAWGEKRLRREADHSLQSSAEVMNEWSYAFTPPIHVHDLELYSKQLHLYRSLSFVCFWGLFDTDPQGVSRFYCTSIFRSLVFIIRTDLCRCFWDFDVGTTVLTWGPVTGFL
jgi:hypothetical protein